MVLLFLEEAFCIFLSPSDNIRVRLVDNDSRYFSRILGEETDIEGRQAEI